MASIYLHIPFCKQRCVYCDFYFVTSRKTYNTFVDALCTEIATCQKQEPVETIYFGGGTPSRLALHDIQRILTTIHRYFDCSGVREVTVEMNPEDASLACLQEFHNTGINRISIGIQSFCEQDLRFMNRSHSEEQACAAIQHIQQAGFDNFTVDLIFGLPHQSAEQWEKNLTQLVTQNVPHISTYGLTIEERTPLHRQVAQGVVQPASDDVLADRYLFTMQYLRQQGYEHYEISSFAQPGYRSQHNQRYWKHANYLGFGPSAHSFWWTGTEASRWRNIRNLRVYEEKLRRGQSPIVQQERLSQEMLSAERILMELRTSRGLNLKQLHAAYNVDLATTKMEILARLEKDGFVEPYAHGTLRLTDRGKLVCDAITTRLLTSEHETAASV